MTWAEICEDKRLQNLPYRIETDRWGHIVMSPPSQSRHAEYQTEIAYQLRQLMTSGRSIAECPLETTDGTKAIDVVWVSHERRASRPNDPAYLIAPEICVEVLSPSNTPEEVAFRRSLFFERGAVEFWVCAADGQMQFFDGGGPISKSHLCPGFSRLIEL